MSSEPSAEPASRPPAPRATYRLQLHAGFPFSAAADVVPYLAALGVSHVYCSPYLQAARGSMHGYDVVDHTRINAELGGASGFAALHAAAREHGLGVVLDVVPNHMAVSEPESQNPRWWELLRTGRDGRAARWFDVDWDAAGGKVVVPVLGAPLAESLADLRVDGDRVRYYEHEFPLAPGTESLASDLPALLAAQHYRLAFWGGEPGATLNYRRFFDVPTLAGIRVEDPEIFDASHRVITDQVRAGELSGLRIDHPDGLADPEGYLAQLADATGDAWVVVEKILEPGESLPASWRCAGTTGYDALNRILGLFIDPAAEAPMTKAYVEATGESGDYLAVVEESKRYVVDRVLQPEIDRLARLLGPRAASGSPLRAALVELLVAFPVYRAYVRPGQPVPEQSLDELRTAVELARGRRPDLGRELDEVARLALEGPDEFVVRFQQTCGPVMAKGVEDTAFYRYARLVALNEVGGDPGRFGVPVSEFARGCEAAVREWPAGMTTLSTHDTKRSEDVRARIAVLSECPDEFAGAVARWSQRVTPPDANTGWLFWQTLVGAWPWSAERAARYLEKATREAKRHTSWTSPDPDYDRRVGEFVTAVFADGDLLRDVGEFVATVEPAGRVTELAQKLIQLTMPGVPDTYQGTELEDLSLVDPDNRRPVDYGLRARLLAELDAGERAPRLDDGTAKLWVVAQALRARPTGGFAVLPASGVQAERVVAFARGSGAAGGGSGGAVSGGAVSGGAVSGGAVSGGVAPDPALVGGDAGPSLVTIAPRLALGLGAAGGWGDTTVTLPEGSWADVLTGRAVSGGEVRLAELLDELPVALLQRQ